MSTTILDARDLTLSYARGQGADVVFDGLSLQLAAGEVVSVLGASGIGKSSLLRVLAGLVPVSRGEVRVGDRLVRGPSARVALAFQDARLLPWLTLEANVRFGLAFQRQVRLTRAEQRERVRDAIEQVGLLHARRKLPAQLSGGMAQRAAFARCIARRPELLLLDEPFAALDEVTRADLQQLLLVLARERGTAIVLSTHDIDEALQLSHRVLVLGGKPAQFVRSFVVQRETVAQLDQLRTEIVHALRDARGVPLAARAATATTSSLEERRVPCVTT